VRSNALAAVNWHKVYWYKSANTDADGGGRRDLSASDALAATPATRASKHVAPRFTMEEVLRSKYGAISVCGALSYMCMRP
jgi:hypothetical protein